jgi:hypothetical protein
VVLVDFLRANADIFTWSPSDMPGIPREVAEHSLDILPHARAVQQRLRRFDEERRRAIGAELRKLLEAGFIKEVFHPTWLANPVLVKKKNGKWRMCIDYTSLNKACPKVPFPLPRIDQVERANGMILQGLKPRIFDQLNKSGRKWLQELPAVVWSLRTTPSRATGFTPFFLVHGAEAVLPTDLEYGSPRVRGYDEDANQRAREDSLDQLDEARLVALMHSARYQQSLRRYQARKIRRRDFSEGDLVLRLRQDNRGRHKLSPPWEGPYVVVKVLKPGTYKLANEDGEELTNAWNIQQLRRFYP